MKLLLLKKQYLERLKKDVVAEVRLLIKQAFTIDLSKLNLEMKSDTKRVIQSLVKTTKVQLELF